MQPGSGDEPSWLKVVDPMAGTYYVPWAQIHQTTGTASVFTKPRDISLCLLYQKGSCNAGNRCHQVHADTTFVASMRALHKHNNNCCPHHGDCLSNLDGFLDPLMSSAAGVYLYGKRITNKTVEIPKRCIGRTIFLERLLSSNAPVKPLHIPADKVCGLHQQNKCLYSHGCRNLHVCRELWSNLVLQQPWLLKEAREPSKGLVKPEKHRQPEAAGDVMDTSSAQHWLDQSLRNLNLGGSPPLDIETLHLDVAAQLLEQQQPPTDPRPPHPLATHGGFDRAPNYPFAMMNFGYAATQPVAPVSSPHQSRLLSPPPPPPPPSPPPPPQGPVRSTASHLAFSGRTGLLRLEEDPSSDVISDSIGSIVDSFGHTEDSSDFVSDILDMPPNLIENLHQLIMEDSKAKGRAPTLRGLGQLSRSSSTLKVHAAPGAKPAGAAPSPLDRPSAAPASRQPAPGTAVHPPFKPQPPPPSPPPPSTPAPHASSMPHAPPLHQMHQQGGQMMLLMQQGSGDPARAPSYLVAVPVDGATAPSPSSYGNAIAVTPQAAQRLLSTGAAVAMVPMPGSPHPPGHPTLPYPVQPQPPLPADAKGNAPKPDARGGGIMKTMSHLTRSGFFGELQELIQWKEAGMLTEAEFTAVKARMLAEHNVAPF